MDDQAAFVRRGGTLRYGLSHRDVEELLAERGVHVDHITVYRWVQRFTPLFADAGSHRQGWDALRRTRPALPVSLAAGHQHVRVREESPIRTVAVTPAAIRNAASAGPPSSW